MVLNVCNRSQGCKVRCASNNLIVCVYGVPQILVNTLRQEIIGEPDAGEPHVRLDERALMPASHLLAYKKPRAARHPWWSF